jgi:8-hydroxy-5-deazaflavin:NADPH oxidoreductase
MKIGIIGPGQMGGGLGRIWCEAGHEVMFCGAGNIAEVTKQVGAVAPAARVGTHTDVAAFGEAILVACQWSDARDALAACGDLAGKILIDIINPLSPGLSGLDVGGATSAAEELAKMAPTAKVVKAFNTIGAKTLLPENRRIDSISPTVFYCGDDGPAKQVVAGLIRDCGYDAVDTGPLRNARYLEPMAMLLIQAMVAGSIPPDAAFRVLRR